MSNTKFTPGPWYAKQRYIMYRDPESGQESWLGHIDEFCSEYKEEEAANAALIAAAPDLYKALEGAESMLLDAEDILRECLQGEAANMCKLLALEAKEALAKARNEILP